MVIRSLLDQVYGAGRENTDSKKTSFDSPSIEISGKTLSVLSDNHFVQLSNITQVRKGLDATTTSFPIIPLIIGGIVGIVLIVLNSTILTVLGLLVLGVTGFYVYKNYEKKNHYGLHIELCSGAVYSFNSTNKEIVSSAFAFLRKVMEEAATTQEHRTFNFGNVVSADKIEGVVIAGDNKGNIEYSDKDERG